MLKYYKEYLSNYQYADFIQLIVLFASIVFFVLLVYYVLSKPKNYYKNTSGLPLEDEDSLF